jgi:hypothetical protein
LSISQDWLRACLAAGDEPDEYTAAPKERIPLMSYSFSVRGATKAQAKEKVAAELAKVVAGQPIHARDQAQAQAAADAFVDLLADDDAKDVVVSVNGSVSWSSDVTAPLTAASVGAGAYLANREA